MSGLDFYTDNPNRETRGTELINDCNFLLNSLSVVANSIATTLTQVNNTYADLMKAKQLAVSAEVPAFESDGFILNTFKSVQKVVTPFAVYPLVSMALRKAAVSYLLSQGRIGQAALIDVIESTFARRVVNFLKVGAVTAAVTILLQIGLDNIEGAKKRDTWRGIIHDAVPVRIELQNALDINNAILAALQTTLSSMNLMKQLGYDEAKLDQLWEVASENLTKTIEGLTKDVAAQELEKLDKSRNSWTAEDHFVEA